MSQWTQDPIRVYFSKPACFEIWDLGDWNLFVRWVLGIWCFFEKKSNGSMISQMVEKLSHAERP